MSIATTSLFTNSLDATRYNKNNEQLQKNIVIAEQAIGKVEKILSEKALKPEEVLTPEEKKELAAMVQFFMKHNSKNLALVNPELKKAVIEPLITVYKSNNPKREFETERVFRDLVKGYKEKLMDDGKFDDAESLLAVLKFGDLFVREKSGMYR